MLYRLAADGPPGGALVEIGSYLGASACFLGAAAIEKDRRLFCIDTWKNETMPDGSRDTWAEFQANTSQISRVITPLRRNSYSLSPHDLPSTIWLAFIDGDHSFEAARHDSELLAGGVQENGILAFHDAIWFSGVAQAIGALLSGGDWSIGGLVDNLMWLRRVARR